MHKPHQHLLDPASKEAVFNTSTCSQKDFKNVSPALLKIGIHSKSS